MSSPLRILCLENDLADAELLQDTLETEGLACKLTRVEAERDFRAALQQGGFDLILADYTLPSFDGLSALRIVRQQLPDVPFIFVSGTLDEEVAIEALKMGATDYVFKTRLSRLVPSVERALRETGERAERNRAEEAARRSEKELRDAIEIIPAMVFIALPGPSNAFVSRSWREYTGLSAQDTSGLGWQTAIHPEDLERHMKKWQVSSATGEPFEDEARFCRAADGEYRWFLIRAVPLHDDLGKVLKWYGVLTDIEDRKRAEALLAGEKHILEMVAKGDSLSEILNSLCRLVEEQASDTRASILLVEGGRLLHGGAPSLPKEYIEAIDGVAIGPEVGSCGTAAYLRKQVIVEDIATDRLWTEYRAAALPHSLRACWSTPIFSSAGKVIGTFAMYYREPRRPSERDQKIIEQITHLAGVAIERKMTFEQLQRSEAYLAEAQRLAHTGSWAWNPLIEHCFYWSAEMFRIYALDPQQGLPTSETFWQRIHPEDRESMRELLWSSALEKAEYEHDHRIVLPDGSVKHIHAIGHPGLDAGELVEYVGTAMDVTEHKHAEEMLRESETRFRTFVDHAGDSLFVYDLEQKTVVDVNRQACESLGYTRQELIGKTPFAYHLDSYEPEMESIAERAMAGETVIDTHWHKRKDGTVFPVEVHTSVVSYAGRRFLMMMARNISDRLQAEEQRERLRQLEADLAHINRVSMVGELGASLAHELNQPITGAITSADACLRWLAREPPELERARAATMRVKKDGTRAAEIINRLRAFYKKGAPSHREAINVQEVVNEIGVLLRNEATRHSVTIRTELPTELPKILADRVQLQQVFMNLMLNAIEAMQHTGGELTIRSQRTDHDMLLISISDTGVGLPTEGADQIFDAFFTTKPQGTGMGLAITRSIVEAHGGRLWASPNAERGTTFRFTLFADAGAMNEQS
jgi:PAS domain S-box-containing protein